MYITSGEPISSKGLCQILENSPSSATLRNEMNALCDMGFLSQPHTSAGRVPTPLAYRLYVESLMPRDAVNAEHKRMIDSALSFAGCDPELLARKAAQVLSEITGLPTIALEITGREITLRRVELLPMSSHTALLILITSDGHSRSRLCSVYSPLTDRLINGFNSLIETRLLGSRLDTLDKAAMQSFLALSGPNSLDLMPLFTALYEMAEEISAGGYSVSGISNLYSMGLGSETAAKIADLLSGKEAILRLLSKTAEPLSIVFGGDTGYNALKPSSIILAKYGANGRDTGCIGVIGPNRMSYELLIPAIRYTAERINALLSSTLNNTEV